MICKILKSGDPKLREISRPVVKIDAKILELIRNLKDTLAIQKEPEGVALAAPQIGKNLRLFVVGYKNFQRVVINPEIIEQKPHSAHSTSLRASRGEAKNKLLEGCLSLPNYYSPLKRASLVKIKYRNEKGKELIETFKDFEAQIILHEIDHLDGILFIDHLLKEKKPLYQVKGEEWEEVELI
jgi:peptide deformylase